jgi:hypothetical protein
VTDGPSWAKLTKNQAYLPLPQVMYSAAKTEVMQTIVIEMQEVM